MALTARHRRAGLAALALLSLVLPASAAGGPITEKVRSTVENVQALLQDQRLQSDARKKERRAQLRQILGRRFDFAEMAKRSLGSNWQKRSSKERADFVKVFSAIVGDAYLDHIELYASDRIAYLREARDGDYAEVDSRVMAVRGEEFPLNYRLLARNSDWKVYDVVIENVSVVSNYRSQFNRILASSSFDGLLKRLRETRATQVVAKRERDNAILSYWLLAQASPNRPR